MNGHDHPDGATLVVPIFPSANVVLFPKVHLSLAVFESRNRRMIQDALAEERLIGMAVIRGGWEKNDAESPEIYSLGCIGQISTATALPDGRYHVVLRGLKEFEILEEFLEPRSYRQAKVLLRSTPAVEGESLSAARRDEILALLGQVGGEKQSEFMHRFTDPALDGETWVNLCCFSLPVSCLEKLSLLGAKSLEERVKCLLEVLHFRVFEKGKPLERLQRVTPRDVPN